MPHLSHSVCAYLKALRQHIADVNGIVYTPTVCTYEGECAGTCPVCDAELKMLTDALAEKKQKGESVTVRNVFLTDPEEFIQAHFKKQVEDAQDPERMLNDRKKRRDSIERILDNLNDELSRETDAVNVKKLRNEIDTLELIKSHYDRV